MKRREADNHERRRSKGLYNPGSMYVPHIHIKLPIVPCEIVISTSDLPFWVRCNTITFLVGYDIVLLARPMSEQALR